MGRQRIWRIWKEAGVMRAQSLPLHPRPLRRRSRDQRGIHDLQNLLPPNRIRQTAQGVRAWHTISKLMTRTSLPL